MSMPLHLIDRLLIDPEYQQDVTTRDTDVHTVSSWCKTHGITAQVTMRSGALHIQATGPYVCPLHKREHTGDNLWGKILKDRIRVCCYRLTREEKGLAICLPRQRDVEEVKGKVQSLIEECERQVHLLKGAVLQSSRYVDLDIGHVLHDKKVIAIRSQLGTGKSQRVEEYLTHHHGKVLIVSHRKTFTSDVARRYGATSYDDIRGDIRMSTHQRVIVQVESLSRVREAEGCTLILDEWESLLSQLDT